MSGVIACLQELVALYECNYDHGTAVYREAIERAKAAISEAIEEHNDRELERVIGGNGRA